MISLPVVVDPDDPQAVVVRTDYSDETGWQELTAALVRPWDGPGEPACLISDPALAGATIDEVRAAAPAEVGMIFVADRTSMRPDLYALLAVSLATPEDFDFEGGAEELAHEHEFGSEFRIMADEVLHVFGDLSYGNLYFSDYAARAVEHPSGVYQGM